MSSEPSETEQQLKDHLGRSVFEHITIIRRVDASQALTMKGLKAEPVE